MNGDARTKKCGMQVLEDYICCPYCGQKLKFSPYEKNEADRRRIRKGTVGTHNTDGGKTHFLQNPIREFRESWRKSDMVRLTIKAPSGLIHLQDTSESAINTAVKRLSDLEDLEEQGKLLKPPCAVGDTVYAIFGGEISEQIVRGILFRENKIFAQAKNGSILGEFGEDVFLTKEEAALQEYEH